MSISTPAVDVLRKGCEEVADNVFHYMSGNQGPNAVFVVGSESILLIDTLMTPVMAEDLHRHIRRVSDKPVAMTVYTHHHGDHTLGNERFAPPAITVGHEICRHFLTRMGDEFVPVYASWRRTPQDAVDVLKVKRVVFPDVTFKDELTLYVDDNRVILKHLGPGHSLSDVIAILPEKEVMVCGDLLSYRGVPGLRDARYEGWIARLDEMYDLAPRVIVPGHGQWTENKEVIREMRDFLAEGWAAAKTGRAAGKSEDEVAAGVDLTRWRDLEFHGLKRYKELVVRAFEDLTGTPSKYELLACHQLAAGSSE